VYVMPSWHVRAEHRSGFVRVVPRGDVRSEHWPVVLVILFFLRSRDLLDRGSVFMFVIVSCGIVPTEWRDFMRAMRRGNVRSEHRPVIFVILRFLCFWGLLDRRSVFVYIVPCGLVRTQYRFVIMYALPRGNIRSEYWHDWSMSVLRIWICLDRRSFIVCLVLHGDVRARHWSDLVLVVPRGNVRREHRPVVLVILRFLRSGDLLHRRTVFVLVVVPYGMVPAEQRFVFVRGVSRRDVRIVLRHGDSMHILRCRVLLDLRFDLVHRLPYWQVRAQHWFGIVHGVSRRNVRGRLSFDFVRIVLRGNLRTENRPVILV